MVGGTTHVDIDPAFARMMDLHSMYLVFLTPLGDSRGLYVRRRTASGFDVAEDDGGKSTLDFDYRLVARPLPPPSVTPREIGQSERRTWAIDPAALRNFLAKTASLAHAAQPSKPRMVP
jgi:hypothetical protein